MLDQFWGGAAVGGAGGRAMAEGINGVPSPPWSLGSDWSQGYKPNLITGAMARDGTQSWNRRRRCRCYWGRCSTSSEERVLAI